MAAGNPPKRECRACHSMEPLLEREIAERQVELAALDEREKLAIVRGFGQRELHLRPLTDEAAERMTHDLSPRRG